MFEGYKILKSEIIVNENIEPDKKYNININPSGKLKGNTFQLKLEVDVVAANESVNIKIVPVGYFSFDGEIEDVHSYFTTNATAILFPYIRAYISLLSSISGINPIVLPTLNLSGLAKVLSENITHQEE